MFPYRRGNKKRGKGAGGRRHRDGTGRRTPSSPQELLSVLQPTTKALAQMLAGNTKASGQLVHARNVLGQAERLIDERQVDRMGPAHREEFLEQVARLKLTIADADAAFGAEEEEEAAQALAKPVGTVAPERLRELALSLATSTSQPAIAAPVPVEEPVEEVIVHAAEPEPVPEPEVAGGKASPRGARLRLKPYASRSEGTEIPAKADAR